MEGNTITFPSCSPHQNVKVTKGKYLMETAEKRRVLVVDDAPDVAVMLDVMLRRAGYDSSMATSATDALALAKRVQFDIVISDLAMPEKDGFSLLRALRTLPEYKKVPMVSLSGFPQYRDPSLSLSLGFDAHLPKPIQPDKFIETVKSVRRR